LLIYWHIYIASAFQTLNTHCQIRALTGEKKVEQIKQGKMRKWVRRSGEYSREEWIA
jgi:hypothetical protein